MDFNRFSLLVIVIMLSIFIFRTPVNGEESSVEKITKVVGEVTIIRDDAKEIMGKP